MVDNFRILLVEDNPDDEQLTMRALRRLPTKAHVDIARDGQEAVDFLLDTSHQLPHLVLLDLKLPKVSGLEVLERIRSHDRTKFLLVVVLTSSDEPSDVRTSYKNFANSYIRKPVAYEEFGDVVRQLGTYWLDTNIHPPA